MHDLSFLEFERDFADSRAARGMELALTMPMAFVEASQAAAAPLRASRC